MEKAPKIVIDHVKKIYRSYDGKETVALNGVDLTIEENEFICVVGPSGCGKTTLLNMIAGLEAVTEGTIRLDGREIVGPGNDRGVVFQQYALFPWLTVRQNIEFGMAYLRKTEQVNGSPVTRRYTRQEKREIAEQYMKMVDLQKVFALGNL